jgi:hypothetical protein
MPVSVVVALGSVSNDLVIDGGCKFAGREQAVQSECALWPAVLPVQKIDAKAGLGQGNKDRSILADSAGPFLIASSAAIWLFWL